MASIVKNTARQKYRAPENKERLMVQTILGQEPAYSLPAVLDLHAAASLKEKLIELLDKKSAETKVEAKPYLWLDGQSVERINTPAIQVLIATDQALQEIGARLGFTGASDVMQEAFSLLGLKHFIDEWSAAGDEKNISR